MNGDVSGIEREIGDLERRIEAAERTSSLSEFLDSVSYQEYLLRCAAVGKRTIGRKTYEALRKRIGI